MPIEGLLTEHSRSTLSRAGAVLVSIVDAAVDKVQVVDFDVATAQVVGVLILLLCHDVGIDVVEGTVRVQAILVQIVRPPISHSLAHRQLIVIVLELVIIAAINVA